MNNQLIYISNASITLFNKNITHWKTARTSEFGIRDGKLTKVPSGMIALFVERSEIEERIKDLKAEGAKESVIAVYENILSPDYAPWKSPEAITANSAD